MNNLKIGVRLGAAFGLLLLLLGALYAVSLTRLAELNTAIQGITQVQMPQTEQVNSMMTEVRTASVRLRNMILETDEQKMRVHRDIFDRARVNYDTAEKELDRLLADSPGTVDGERQLVAKIKEHKPSLRASQDRVMALALQNKTADATTLLLEDTQPIVDKTLAPLAELVKLENKLSLEAAASSALAYASARSILTGVAALAALLAVVAAVLVTRSITRPVGEALALANRLAEGDLRSSVTTNSRDEVGQMLAALQNMTEKLASVVSDVNGNAESLASASEEVSATAQTLSQAASEQAAGVEETSASLEQMTASISQNTDNAKVTDGMATKAAGRGQRRRPGGGTDRGRDEADRQEDRHHRRHRLPDQPAGAERGDRGRACRRAWQGLCRGGRRSAQAGRAQPGGGAGDRHRGQPAASSWPRRPAPCSTPWCPHQEDQRAGAGDHRRVGRADPAASARSTPP